MNKKIQEKDKKLTESNSEENRKGYKIKIKKTGRSKLKMPIYCPNESCKMITSNLDDPYLEKYGICWNCWIMYVENKKEPLLNVEYYKKRLEERGY